MIPIPKYIEKYAIEKKQKNSRLYLTLKCDCGCEEFYLYKESTSTWSLIVSKGHGQKYGDLRVKINNPNEGIGITKLGTHLASLPSNTTNDPLKTSSCIDNTTPCTVTYTDGSTGTINLVTR